MLVRIFLSLMTLIKKLCTTMQKPTPPLIIKTHLSLYHCLSKPTRPKTDRNPIRLVVVVVSLPDLFLGMRARINSAKSQYSGKFPKTRPEIQDSEGMAKDGRA